ncbi:hypothetical protein ACS0TY_020633 [Phlomoides rotata]
MAAASSATAAGAITAQTRISSENRRVSISVSFPTPHATKQRRKLVVVVRNSGEESARATEQEIEIPVVEAPKGPPSLISALNVDKALRGLAITDVDHYGRLGLQSGCSYDQVSIAYNSKIAEVMNKGLDDEEELNKELELLKSILSCVEERRMYDWSLARSRSGKPERFVWPYEVDITQAPIGDPPPQEAEDEGPTKLTGYFFLAWLILSFTLLIAFNR